MLPYYGHSVECLELIGTGEQGKMAALIQLTSRSPGMSIPTRLTRTFEPLKVPSCTGPIVAGRPMFRRESGSVHISGKICRAPHISVSSRRHSWNAWFVGMGVVVRIYTCVEYGSLQRRFVDSRYPGAQPATPSHRFVGLERSFDSLSHEGDC